MPKSSKLSATLSAISRSERSSPRLSSLASSWGQFRSFNSESASVFGSLAACTKSSSSSTAVATPKRSLTSLVFDHIVSLISVIRTLNPASGWKSRGRGRETKLPHESSGRGRLSTFKPLVRRLLREEICSSREIGYCLPSCRYV